MHVIMYFFIVLPAAPLVNVITDNQHFEVCILSEDILTDFYEIALHDVTGELLVLTEHNNAANCTNIFPELNKPNLQGCAPFMLTVSAINPFGVSSTNVTVQNGAEEIGDATNTSESNTSICSCFKENGELQVDRLLDNIMVFETIIVITIILQLKLMWL